MTIDDVAERADRLYAAWSVLADLDGPGHRFGIAEIVRFLDDPSRSLTAAEQRALFANPRLRADYQRLKAQMTAFALPALVAASSGDVEARRFDGGGVSVHRSRVPNQVYVVLRFSRPASSPRMMLLENPGGDLVKRALPAANAQGEVVLVLDERRDDDAIFLRLLADSTSTGAFML